MLKVLTIVGTRPELIRLSRVISEFDKSFEHILAHTGQNFDDELNKVFFNDLGIRNPDYFMDCTTGSETPSSVIGKILCSSDEIMNKENPDCIVVLGDTNSSLSVIAAKKRKIPIFHLEAGNRCFDQRVPEEVNRKIVDHVADINLPYSSIARQYLIDEGFPSDQIVKIGSPMYEVLDYYKKQIENSKILRALGITENNYFLVSAHREENINSEKNFDNLVEVLNFLARRYKLPIIVSTHPRTRIEIKKKNLEFDELIKFEKPFGFFDYVHLQKKAKVVLSDSGTISEESSILGFKALNIREVNERPEAMEEGSVIMTGLDRTLIETSIEIFDGLSGTENKNPRIVRDYEAPNLSIKLVKIILSYTHYVKSRVWKI